MAARASRPSTENRERRGLRGRPRSEATAHAVQPSRCTCRTAPLPAPSTLFALCKAAPCSRTATPRESAASHCGASCSVAKRAGALRLPHLEGARLAQPVHEPRVAVLFVRPDLCQDGDALPRPCQPGGVAKSYSQCASRGLRRAGECIRSAETALLSLEMSTAA